jgi:hypothetical protein
LDLSLYDKWILSISDLIPAHLKAKHQIYARMEAYGPSLNQGLCYESCAVFPFEGILKGNFFLGLDGATRKKLYPRLAEKRHGEPKPSEFKGLIDELMLEFHQLFSDDFSKGMPGLLWKPIQKKDNELIPIDVKKSREWIFIFFLKDTIHPSYLGRLYGILEIESHKTLDRETEK